MKQSTFITLILVASFVLALGIFQFLLPDYVREGGPLVVVLIVLTLMQVTFIVERSLSLRQARGRRSPVQFTVDVIGLVREKRLAEALEMCDEQRGTLANILKAGIGRFRQVQEEKEASEERKASEVLQAFEKASSLEMPLLERNLIALSTIASIATMVGLLGTVIGMIRCFRAMSHSGAPDAIQLAVGISEALINTAGGLFAAIGGIVAYNYFVNRVDAFSYEVEEATHQVTQLLTGRA